MNQYSVGFSQRRVSPALALLAAAALLAPCAAQATPFVIHMVQSGSDVVATGSGAIDLTGLDTPPQLGATSGSIILPFGAVLVLTTSFAEADTYTFTPIGSYPTQFGGGMSPVAATSAAGEPTGIGTDGFKMVVIVPHGYSSESLLPSSAIWRNATFASLGVNLGGYTWRWGNGADQSFTLDIEPPTVPEPNTLGMFSLGLLLLGSFMTLRRRESRTV